MDIDVALAIDAESEDITWRPAGVDVYDARGNAIQAAHASVPSRAAIQPVTGRALQDLPEGIRTEVQYVGWTRAEVAEDDQIIYRGVTYRVFHVKPRPMDGFTRIAIGKVGP